MDPECQVAKLGQRRRGLVCGALEAATNGRVTAVAQRATCDLQFEGE